MSKDSALSRALARIDELEAKLSNISIAARGVVNAFEPKVQEVAGRRMRNAIGALDLLTAEDTMLSRIAVARTEQAQESTDRLGCIHHADGSLTYPAGTEGAEALDVASRFCASCGCQGGVHHGWCKS